jgi:uncharacterized membrane protein
MKEKASGSGDYVSKSEHGAEWYDNTRTIIVLLIVLGSSITLPYFRKLLEWFPSQHPAVVALLAGVIVAVVTYPPMRFADRKFALSNAILLGLLVAEFVIYGAPYDFPAPLAVSFFFFMYMMGREGAEDLWPEEYQGKW